MWAILEAAAHIIDWRFAVGLFVGFILALRYLVGVYHPILRALTDEKATKDNE